MSQRSVTKYNVPDVVLDLILTSQRLWGNRKTPGEETLRGTRHQRKPILF